MDILKPGVYAVDDGCRICFSADFRQIKVIQREQPQRPSRVVRKCCRSCVQFAQGYANATGQITTVCLAKPKRYNPTLGRQLYYRAYSYRRGDCPNYQPRPQDL